MGPPELPGGNTLTDLRTTLDERRLQWGRRNYPAETAQPQVEIPFGCRLQWGRRNYPAETRIVVRSCHGAEPRLQWGRRNYPAETGSRF